MKRIQDVEKYDLTVPAQTSVLLPGVLFSYGGQTSDCYIDISDVIGKITKYVDDVVEGSAGTGTVTYDTTNKYLMNSGSKINDIILSQVTTIGPSGSQTTKTVSSSQINSSGVLKLDTPTDHHLYFHPATGDSNKTFEVKTNSDNDFSVISGVGLFPKIWNLGSTDEINTLKSYLGTDKVPEGTIIFAWWPLNGGKQFSMYIKLKQLSSTNYVWYQIKAAGAVSKPIS